MALIDVEVTVDVKSACDIIAGLLVELYDPEDKIEIQELINALSMIGNKESN